MSGMRQFDEAERRRRLAVRHMLAPGHRAGGPAEVARQLVALHATDPATVYLAVCARTSGPVSPAMIEESLYQRRELLRMLAMRRTLFVVPAELVPVVQSAVTDKIASQQRALTIKLLIQAGVPDPEPFLDGVERSVLRIMSELDRPVTAAELTAAEPRLRTTLTLAEGKRYQATENITSRVLRVLAAQGWIVRGKPVGSWLSQQYRWSLADGWLRPAPGPAKSAPGLAGLDQAAARAALAGHWLAAFGPAPLADLKWWSGWTMTHARQAAAAAGAVEVGLAGGRAGLALPDDLEQTPDPGDWAALLPALDPTVMGWSDRSWFLGPHGPAVFDANGNAGPTVWSGGRVVGAWAQRRDGEITVRLLTDVGAQARALIDAEADRVRTWLGEVRIIPRFRTPAERELSG
jgi:hypothetical protein